MTWRRWLVMAVCLALAATAQAQQFVPRVGYVYPAGGQQGTEFQVTLGGQFLDGVQKAFISGAGVQATLVEYVKPITQQQFNQLRERLQELQQKRDPEKYKEIAEIRQKIATFLRRPSSPALAETVTLRVKLAADAGVGPRELRLATQAGATNPLTFYVGQLPEFSEELAVNTIGDRATVTARLRGEQQRNQSAPPQDITLPVVVNGQMLAGTVDRYRFAMRKGQRLVAVARARELIPYLPDAVPGWFQATLTLYDAAGKELAYADDYRFQPDPALACEIPADGQYLLEIKDALYRGREDFVYRLTLGELPFVTSIFPLGAPAGTETTFELQGWNLPFSRLTWKGQGKAPGIESLFVTQDAVTSNRVLLAVDTLPECREQEPNSRPDDSQRVTLPVIVNGRIDASDDYDVFRFDGHAGDEVVAEVVARRLNSPLDSILRLTDAAGRTLAANDDHEDKGTGLLTHHADSWLRARLPADGVYYVQVGDAQHRGGSEYAYRARLGAPQPDFELRVAPSSLAVRGGAHAPLTVYALRKDGFAGPIAVRLQQAPQGFRLGGGQIPANQDQVRVTLAAPVESTKELSGISLEGVAVIDGREHVHPAVPADDMMQAFAYRHLVPAQELTVAVVGRPLPRGPVRILSGLPVKIPADGTARVKVDVPLTSFAGKLQMELHEPPEGITIQEVASAGLGSEIVLKSDGSKAKAGLAGNLIVNVFVQNPRGLGNGPGRPPRQRALAGALPAIPFEVVGNVSPAAKQGPGGLRGF